MICGLGYQAMASGSELVIHFTAIQRILATQVFTEDGRKFIKGTPTAKCSFAYLQDPVIEGDGGLLQVKARFSGRSALNLFGKCIGLGDSLDVTIHAMPYYQDGFLRLKNVRVDSNGKDSVYVHRVRAGLARSLTTQFTYHVVEEAKRLLERKQAGGGYAQELARFHVPAVRVTSDAVILLLDFALTVK